MISSALKNHRIRIRRPTTVAGDLGGTTLDLTLIGDVAASVSEIVPIEEQERGAGEFTWGVRRVSVDPTDVLERDILEVYEGPESPVNLRVISKAAPAARIRSAAAHHLVLTAEPWNGEVPA